MLQVQAAFFMSQAYIDCGAHVTRGFAQLCLLIDQFEVVGGCTYFNEVSADFSISKFQFCKNNKNYKFILNLN